MKKTGTQFNTWDTGAVGPFPGTDKNPQGRLMRPEYSGDPYRHAPDNWMANETGNDTLTYHTNLGDLPEYDDPERFSDGPFADSMTEDPSGRPFLDSMGSTVGMHFGTIEAGYDRNAHKSGADKRNIISHPVKIAESTFHENPNDVYGLWTDENANKSDTLTDKVEAGGTIPYRNDLEHQGSTSYRTSRDVARSWSDDIRTSHANSNPRFGPRRGPAPALKAAVNAGYELSNPTGQLLPGGDSSIVQRDGQAAFEGMHNPEVVTPRSMRELALSGTQFALRKQTDNWRAPSID